MLFPALIIWSDHMIEKDNVSPWFELIVVNVHNREVIIINPSPGEEQEKEKEFR